MNEENVQTEEQTSQEEQSTDTEETHDQVEEKTENQESTEQKAEEESPDEAKTEEPESHTQETIAVPDDSEMLATMKSIQEATTWNFAVSWIIVCLLFFILFFTAMKAGKN